LSSGLQVSGAADAEEAALLVAKERLEAVGIETPLRAGRQEGTEGNVAWEVEMRPYGAGEEAERASRLQAFWTTATVTWREGRGSRPHSLRLTTLKLRRSE
jgi:hypothetical protein